MGRKVLAGVLAWIALLAGAALLPQSEPQAQSSPTPPQFCYTGASGQPQCFDAQSKAEAALRAEPVPGGALAQWRRSDSIPLTTVYGQRRYTYYIPDLAAETLYAPSYAVIQSDGYAGTPPPCTPSADSYYAGWCADEGDAIDRLMDGYQTAYPDCSFSAPSAVDERPLAYRNVNGFTTASDGRHGTVNYGNRRYATTRTCSGSATTLQFVVYKQASYVCPTDAVGLNDSSTSGYGDGRNDIELPTLCRNDRKRTIDGPMLQVASCPANGNPCYPATGDKARFETDFDFAGRSFTRSYHALNQVSGTLGMAQGWTHSFSERLDGATSGSPTLVTAEGYYETFVAIGNDRYRAENSQDKVLERVIGAFPVLWRLRDAGGEVREFDGIGRLIALRRADAPLRDLVFAYGNTLASSQGALAEAGYLRTVTDAQGRQLRFEYGPNQLLARIVKPDGSTVQYGYDADGNLVFADYGAMRIKQYHYAEAGLTGDASQRHHLTGITAESGQRYASFRYDAQGRAIESRVLGSPNEVTTVAYASDTQATVVTANGLTRGYTIQQPGLYRRITGISEAGDSLSQQYDATGRLSQSTDKRGVITQYEYAAGYRSAVIQGVGTAQQRRQETDRDPASQRLLELRTKDAAGILLARTTYAYNTRGQLTTLTAHDPAAGASRIATTTYCEPADVTAGTCPVVGLVRTIDGPRTGVSDTVSFTYRQTDATGCATAPTTCAYRKGDLWKTTNALGHVAEVLAYDGAGRVMSVKDARGIVTDLEYDSRGWLTARKTRGADAASELDDVIVRIEYTADGLVRKQVRPDRGFTLFGYDAGQRLTTVADSDGNAIVYTLNAAGERIAERTFDATGTQTRSLSRSFDALGRLASITDAFNAQTVFAYDAEGNRIGSTDALLRATGHAYDPLGRMTASIGNANAVTGASDRAQSLYAYDALDRLTRVTDPKGLHTDYSYNAFGERTQLSSPDTGITTYGYDAAGNQTTSTDARGVTTNVAYDALNRPTTISYPSDGTQTIGFGYDTASSDCTAGETYLTGRLAQMTDASGSTSWCYDRYGQLTQKVQRTDGRAFALRYLWAPAAPTPGQDWRLVSRPGSGKFHGWRYPDGAEVRVSQDREGRVFQLDVVLADGRKQRLLTQARYHPFGPVAGWEYGNGLVHRRTVNANYQPGVIQTGTETNGTLVANPTSLSLGYQFDAVGNLIALRDGNQSEPALRTYGYDGLDRLTEVRDGGNSQLLQGYAYDATGNRTSETEGAATTAYGYATISHRLTAVGNQNRSYDAVGNTLRIGGAAQAAQTPQTAAQPLRPLWRQAPDDGQAERRARAGDARGALARASAPARATQAPMRTAERVPASANEAVSSNARWQAPDTARAGMWAQFQAWRAQRDGAQADADDGRSRPFWQWRQREQAAAAANAAASDVAASPIVPVMTPAGNADTTGKAFPSNIVRDFTYNAANRMSEVKHNGTTAMQYRYNGKGEQVLKFNASQRIATVYDEAGRWIGDYDATTGTPLQQVIWLQDLPVGLLVGSGSSQKLYYIEPDMLGTPRVVLDPATSQAVWRWDLTGEAFGDSAPNQDPDGNGTPFVFDMRFPGQRYDAVSGLSQNYYREYDSASGRYSQSDPIELRGGVSLYGYVGGNPLARIDTRGLLQWAVLQTEVKNNAGTGTQVSLYTGATRPSSFGPGTLALTSIDWEIKGRCICGGDGNYSLDELDVSFTPKITLRRRYRSSRVSTTVRHNEQDHVNDLSVWADGAKANADALEKELKSSRFSSEEECKRAAKNAMQQYLYDGILPALIESRRRWDEGGSSAPHYVPNAWD